MRVHFKAMESYGEGNSTSQAMVADKVELIQMLFDGLIDSLVTAKGHIQRGAIEDKNKSLVRAGRIGCASEQSQAPGLWQCGTPCCG